MRSTFHKSARIYFVEKATEICRLLSLFLAHPNGYSALRVFSTALGGARRTGVLEYDSLRSLHNLHHRKQVFGCRKTRQSDLLRISPASMNCLRRSLPLSVYSKQKTPTCVGVFCLAHPNGFEPSASGVGVLRSIQVSYGCILNLCRSAAKMDATERLFVLTEIFRSFRTCKLVKNSFYNSFRCVTVAIRICRLCHFFVGFFIIK